MNTGEVKEIGLLDISDGAIGELVGYELSNILKNISDLNTRPESKRQLKITIDFAATEDRQSVGTSIKVESKLAPIKPFSTMLILGGTEDEPVVAEFKKQVPGQINLDGEESTQSIIRVSKNA
ncbi:MAG: hypothetical protein RSE36_03355 [Oscillospiraceae bacterium]